MSHVAWQDIKISPCGKFHTLNNSPIYLFLFNQVMKYHSPGLAAVEDKSGSYHIDINGAPKYNKRFIETYGFYDDLAAVKDKTGWFHIHPDGTECYPSRYLWCGNFQEDLCVVKDKKNNISILTIMKKKLMKMGILIREILKMVRRLFAIKMVCIPI